MLLATVTLVLVLSQKKSCAPGRTVIGPAPSPVEVALLATLVICARPLTIFVPPVYVLFILYSIQPSELTVTAPLAPLSTMGTLIFSRWFLSSNRPPELLPTQYNESSPGLLAAFPPAVSALLAWPLPMFK